MLFFKPICSLCSMLYSEWVVCPSDGFPCNLVEEVANEVEEQLEDLEEVAEGDAKPEGETTSQHVEQTSVLEAV